MDILGQGLWAHTMGGVSRWPGLRPTQPKEQTHANNTRIQQQKEMSTANLIDETPTQLRVRTTRSGAANVPPLEVLADEDDQPIFPTDEEVTNDDVTTPEPAAEPDVPPEPAEPQPRISQDDPGRTDGPAPVLPRVEGQDQTLINQLASTNAFMMQQMASLQKHNWLF